MITVPAFFKTAPRAALASSLRWLFPPKPAVAGVMPGYWHPRWYHRRWPRRTLGMVLFAFCFLYFGLFLLLPTFLAVPATIPVIILALVTIWALPVSDTPPSGIITFGFWGFFITLLLWPYYIAITLPGIPWITAQRLFGIPMLLMMLYATSTSRPFRQKIVEITSAARPVLWFLVAFAFCQVLSTIMSINLITSVNRLFSNGIAWTGMFFAALWVFRDPRSLDRWVHAYLVMVAILCVVGLFEYRAAHILWKDSIPDFMLAKDELVQQILKGAYRLTGEYRIVTTATTPLSLAELMALSMPLIFYVVSRNPKPWVIAAAVAFDLVIIWTINATDSRLGFVGLIIAHLGCLMYYTYVYRRDHPHSPGAWVLVLSFPAVGVLSVCAVLFVGRIRVLVLGGGQHSFSNQGRQDQWALMPSKILDNPIFGYGPAQGAAKLGFTSPSGKLTIDSYYLSILMDYGIVGFISYYGMFIAAIVIAFRSLVRASEPYRTLNAALLIMVVEFVVIKAVLSQEANHTLAFIIIAAICAATYHDKTARLAKARGDIVPTSPPSAPQGFKTIRLR